MWKNVAKNFLFSMFFPFFVLLSVLHSNYCFWDDIHCTVHTCLRPLVVYFRMFTHFSGNVHITNAIYVSSTQSFMLILTVTYFFSSLSHPLFVRHFVIMYEYVACGCYFSDFVSILFKHKSFITHLFSFVKLMIFHSL